MGKLQQLIQCTLALPTFHQYLLFPNPETVAAKEINELYEKEESSNEPKQNPVTKNDTTPGKYDYYLRNKNGTLNESRYQTQDSVYIPGKNGAPDTVHRTTHTQPPTPKKDIPRSNK
jgi:hypothetical protein